MNRVRYGFYQWPYDFTTAPSRGTSFRSEAELATNLSMWATDPRPQRCRAWVILGDPWDTPKLQSALNFGVQHRYGQPPCLAGGTLKTL